MLYSIFISEICLFYILRKIIVMSLSNNSRHSKNSYIPIGNNNNIYKIDCNSLLGR